MKIVKKFFKVVFILLLIVLLAGSGYTMYDYYKNPEKYDEFAQAFKDKATGKDQITVEEVSPFVTPKMTLTLDNTPYEGMHYEPHVDYKPMEPIIMCYGKDMGGKLYVPVNLECYDPKLFGGSGVPEQDISEYVTYNASYQRIEIAEELLMRLDAGEYYIIADFRSTDGTHDFTAAMPLILEEETTFNSTQRGFVYYGDAFGWIVNDLEDPKDISFTFYNLGDNPIRALLYDSERGGGYLTQDVEPENYEINARGDTVTLKAEYLARLPVNTTKRFVVRLANGDILETDWTVVGTIDGDSLQRMTITGPETYSLSQGGDYVATYDPGMCDKLHTLWLERYGSDGIYTEFIKEVLRGEDTGEYLSMSERTITFPEEFMKELGAGEDPYRIKIGYFINGTWFDAFLEFRITE